MTGKARPGGAWQLAKRQHGVISRRQLLALGLTRHAIEHRLSIGRLHRVLPGVYAVGRPELSAEGRYMAAVLAAGEGALLSHVSAASLWGIPVPQRFGSGIELTVPAPRHPKVPEVRIHSSRRLSRRERARRSGIPVTSPARTLIDLAPRLPERHLESAVIAADKLDLVRTDDLRRALAERPGVPGVPALRRLLDGPTFAVTDSVLERRFLRLVAEAGLSPPETGVVVADYRSDFCWPELGLIVETDGLRYHRTPSQQARDRRRDNAYLEAGFTPLRFTHEQIFRHPAEVRRTLVAVFDRLRGERERRVA